MKKSILNLIKRGIKIEKVVVDGKFIIPDLDVPQEAIIKGDDKLWQIGAASIIGKVYRDNHMAKLANDNEQYSYYDWESNAGYYTPKHRNGIIIHGPTPLHRKNFKYFKYCLFCHNKLQDFLSEGKSVEDYKEWMRLQKKNKSSFEIWKEGAFDCWKEIPYGRKF
jgi:ribonuclease HII